MCRLAFAFPATLYESCVNSKLAFHLPLLSRFIGGEPITRHGPYWADWVEIIGRVASSSLQDYSGGSSSSKFELANLENSFPQLSGVRSIPPPGDWSSWQLARVIDGAARQSTRAKRVRS